MEAMRLRAAAKKWMNRQKLGALNHLRDRARAFSEQKRLVNRVIRGWKMDALARGWRGLRAGVEYKAHQKYLVKSCLDRWAKQRLIAAWNSWRYGNGETPADKAKREAAEAKAAKKAARKAARDEMLNAAMDDALLEEDEVRPKRKSLWGEHGDHEMIPILPYNVLSQPTRTGEQTADDPSVQYVAGSRARPLDERHTQRVTQLAFAPSGKGFASSSKDKTVRIFAFPDGVHVGTCAGHSAAVNAVCYEHKGGGRLATGSDDKTVGIWDAKFGSNKKMLEGHHCAVLCVAWRPRSIYSTYVHIW